MKQKFKHVFSVLNMSSSNVSSLPMNPHWLSIRSCGMEGYSQTTFFEPNSTSIWRGPKMFLLEKGEPPQSDPEGLGNHG